MTIPCFSSLEELRPTFGKGISVTFSGDKRPFSSFINTVEQFEGYPRFRIVIGTIPDHFKNINARGSNLLEDQEITLIHELLHIFHHWTTGQDLGFLREAFGLERKEYERLTDEEAFKIVRQDDNLFVAIVLELTTYPKCSCLETWHKLSYLTCSAKCRPKGGEYLPLLFFYPNR